MLNLQKKTMEGGVPNIRQNQCEFIFYTFFYIIKYNDDIKNKIYISNNLLQHTDTQTLLEEKKECTKKEK